MKSLTTLFALSIALTSLACTVATAATGAAPAASAPAMAQACRDDVQKLCPGVAPGEGRIAACLRDKRQDLSKDCKAALVKARRGANKDD